MIAVLVLLALAAASLLLAPVVLTAGRWQVRHPAVALGLWHGALGFGLLAALGSVVVAVTIAVNSDRGDGGEAVFATLFGWGSLAAIGAAVALIASNSETIFDVDRANRDSMLSFAQDALEVEGMQGIEVLRCESAVPMACTIPGKNPMILISSAFEDALTRPQLIAVLEHERAHLTQRHHIAMRLADVNAACLPRVAASRRFRRATALLVELLADDAAAKKAGAVNLANALTRMAAVSSDPSLELRAERLATRRWPRRRSVRTAAMFSLR